MKMTAENNADRDEHLPTVLLGYRATIQTSTRYTPFHLLYGREMTLPMENMSRIAAPDIGYEDPTAQAVMDNLKPWQKTLKAAKQNIAEPQRRQIAHYARRHLHWSRDRRAQCR